MNILLALSHSIEEYDQLRLLYGLGYSVASIGGYIDPAHPHDPKRPALPEVPLVETVKQAVDQLGTADNLGTAQSRIPKAILDWLGDDGVIIYHHYLDRLYGQWPYILDWLNGSSRRRVIWRTVGQSVENNERQAAPYRAEGLEIVRYSPKERNIPSYAGEDALIRFYKDPADYGGWTGEGQYVLGFGQHYWQRSLRDPDRPWLGLAPRGLQYLNFGYFAEATKGLPTRLLGPGSEVIGGVGQVPYEDLLGELQRARVYMYTGTQPASYTLGLIEAMMTGTPVVSIGPDWFRCFPYGPELFEGHEIALRAFNEPADAAKALRYLLDDGGHETYSANTRQVALDLFGRDKAEAAWQAFLG